MKNLIIVGGTMDVVPVKYLMINLTEAFSLNFKA